MKIISRIMSVRRTMAKIFGSVSISWSPPEWMRSLQTGLASGRRSWLIERAREIRTRLKPLMRRAAIIVPASLLLVVVVGIYAIGQVGLIRVSGSPPGLTRLEDVLRPDPLQIYFSGSAAQLSAVGKVVEKGITMSPSLPGEWKWVNDRTLRFVPKADWAVGQ